jgi:hypothetical protein
MTDKPVAGPDRTSDDRFILDRARQRAADREFDSYEFGREVADAGAWERVTPGTTWTRPVYVKSPDAPTVLGQFTVVFNNDAATIANAYATVDGETIGNRPRPTAIIATWHPQAWVGDLATRAGDPVEFDVTRAVLALPLAEIRTLRDDQSPIDYLADAAGVGADHGGPFWVEVQQAAERFFGVDNLADVTREMLDAARAALLPLDKATQVWQTHVIVTVLSQGDFPTSKMSLEDIARQIDEGDWIGTVNMRAPIRVPPENVRPLLLSIGNDGTFFGDAPDDVDTAAPP